MSKELVESGIEWIGKYPKDWKLIKSKFLLSITTGKKDAIAENPDGKYEFFTCSTENKKTDNYCFDQEALLVCGNGEVGFTRYYNGKFDAYQRTYVLGDFNINVFPIYLKYYFNGLLSKKLELDKVGSVIDFIKLGDIQNFLVCLPAKSEQEKIVKYLDSKVTKIDQTINDNKKSIELLEEYKINLISKTIKNNESNSEKIKLKHLGTLQNGISAGAEKFGTGNEIFVNYGDVYNNFEIPKNPVGKISLTDKEKETYSLKKGDVLFTRTSETIEEVGMTSVCMSDYPNSAYSGFVIRFRPNKDKLLYEGYSKYYFKMREHRDYFAREMNLVTRASLSQGLLNNLVVILPDYNRQIEISKFLDRKFELLNKSIKYRKQIIEKLEEYKKSLIYEVVTGKIEV